jgi:homoserine acetyltransferase
MTNPIDSTSLNMLAATPSMGSSGRNKNWFEAFAGAWGRALDRQADVIVQKSDALGQENGQDKPSDITELTAESMRLSFMANSSHTSLDSVSKALETMARKG